MASIALWDATLPSGCTFSGNAKTVESIAIAETIIGNVYTGNSETG